MGAPLGTRRGLLALLAVLLLALGAGAGAALLMFYQQRDTAQPQAGFSSAKTRSGQAARSKQMAWLHPFAAWRLGACSEALRAQTASHQTMRPHWSQVASLSPLRAAASASPEIFRWQPPHLPSWIGAQTGWLRVATRS